MTSQPKTTILFAALASAALAALAASPWKIERTQDEITDVVSYFVYTPGTPVKMSDVLSYTPNLVVKVTPKKTDKHGALYFAGDVMLQIETDGLDRRECEIIARYDKRKPMTATCQTSTDRRAAFSPDWHKTIARLKASTNLTVRYMTTLGHIRTTTFDVRDLSDALQRVKSLHQKPTAPKSPAPDRKPAATVPNPPASDRKPAATP